MLSAADDVISDTTDDSWRNDPQTRIKSKTMKVE